MRGEHIYNTQNANPMCGRYLRRKLDYYFEIWKRKDMRESDYKAFKDY